MELNKGFKQTEIGKIPNDWECLSLDQTVDIIDGDRGNNYPKAEDFKSSGDCLFLNAGNVTKNGFNFEDCQFITAEKDKALGKGKLQREDFVLTTRGTVGNFSYYAKDIPFDSIRINSGMVILRQKIASLCGRYLYSAFRSGLLSQQISNIAFGSAQPQLTVRTIAKLRIPLPQKPDEQEAIANALSDADAYIESLKKLIAKKRLIRQSLLQELFAPKKGWKEFRLGDCAILKARIGWQGLTTAEYLDSGDYGLVTGTDFKNGKIDWDNCHYVTKDRYDQDRNIQLKENDILVTKDGTIGKVALISSIPQPTTLNSGVFVVRPISNAFDQKCFYYLLSSVHFDEFLAQLAAGSTISHLYQKDFVHFKFKLPASDEQKRIGSVLFDVDSEIEIFEKKLRKARLVKQGMTQELLTGRIRLV